MGKLHYFTALLLVVLLAVVSGWIFESIEKSPILTKEKLRHDPDYYLKNFTSTTMDATGNPAYQVKANHLEHYPDDDSTKLQQAKFSFFKEHAKIWTVQANEALVLKNGEKILLTGNVILNQILSSNNKLPMIIKAEQLTVEPERNLAYTKSKIKLLQGKSYIQAIGMRADMNKNKIEFLAKTRSHYVLPAE